ncbi:MAG TPA: PstS family phosphate ABC transporter substrate-binding protein [Chryseosolibacter sp.]|nr:PstS family phosphate ABC transporter substrate-binding protein [Chryseosolibacter sp.]
MMRYLRFLTFLFSLVVLASCGSKSGEANDDNNNTDNVSGEIKIDGSSTVYPITEAIAEEFRAEQPDVKVTVGVSGTGGGFKKFSRGEIDINNASRPIKTEEAANAKENNLNFVELKVAYDGLVVVVNKDNTWVNDITVEELKRLWEPDAQGKVMMWNEIRKGWPAEEFHLYGPGVASGTYDYFTEAVVGKSGASRGDYTASEDDNVLVQGISGDKNGIGFFGLAYYEENKDLLKLVGVNDGKGVVVPGVATVKDGTYSPLSRPVFIYVSDAAAKKDHVRKFVDFYLSNAASLVQDVGYIPLTTEEYKKQVDAFSAFGK